jgi:hypothetical protein
MKKLMLHIAMALSLCVTLGLPSLSAQVTHTIAANIPFDFTVLNLHFNAGTYTVTSESPQSAICIRGKDGSAMFALALPAQANNVQQVGRLVFHKYGDQYFLSKIWYAGSDQGRELRVSKVEQEVAEIMPKPTETTVVVARSKPHKPAP